MTEARVGRALMGLGVSVGVIAASFGLIDAQLNIPDWMIRIAMIKLLFVTAGGFLAVGALIVRHARSPASVSEETTFLGEGSPEEIHHDPRVADPVARQPPDAPR